MIAGQQMDVNFLYQKVCELSEVLKENRERTQGIISSAEELAVSTHTQLHGCAIQMSTKPSRFHWLIRHLVCRRVLLPMELPPLFKKPMQRYPVCSCFKSLTFLKEQC